MWLGGIGLACEQVLARGVEKLLDSFTGHGVSSCSWGKGGGGGWIRTNVNRVKAGYLRPLDYTAVGMDAQAGFEPA